MKLKHRQELVIAGYTRGQGRRSNGIGALVLGVHDADGLRYAGNVGTGFTDRELDRLEALLKPLRRDDDAVRGGAEDAEGATRRTWSGSSRRSWRRSSSRSGRGTAGCARPSTSGSVTTSPRTRWSPSASRCRPRSAAARRVLKLSNLDKPFWPDEGITKGDLLAYYRDVAPVLVPHLRDRPFTMKRYPDGWQGKFFFQKDAPKHMPDWIPRAPFPASTREGEKRIIDYALVNDDLALLWMVNMGCIDMNAWTSRADRADRPDWVMFDLDPSEDVGFPEVIEVALLVKQLLDLAGLESFPKTSGSRGIHVLVPIARRQGFDATRSFAAVDRRRARPRPPRPRDDGVDEAEAPRRPRRREPERPGKDDRSGLLGAPARRSTRLDAAGLGRGARGARSRGVHVRRGADAGRPSRRPFRARARRCGSRSRRR